MGESQNSAVTQNERRLPGRATPKVAPWDRVTASWSFCVASELSGFSWFSGARWEWTDLNNFVDPGALRVSLVV